MNYEYIYNMLVSLFVHCFGFFLIYITRIDFVLIKHKIYICSVGSMGVDWWSQQSTFEPSTYAHFYLFFCIKRKGKQ
jgi:hypothetical protein